uniref:Uncharacterized protein n=1 Tax=Amphimedon queenslandica TaxID=400682 RepID=A0A1X7UE88_AMPQE
MACAVSYKLEGDITKFKAELLQETTSNVQNVVFLDSIYDILKDLEGFTVVKCDSEYRPCLVIQHQMLHNHPPLGLISRCRILIKGQEYVVHIVLKEIKSGTLINPTDVMLLCERYHLESNSYKFCPCIDEMEYQQHKEVIRFDIESLRKS